MNTKAKGAALERRFIGILEKCGYACEKARAEYTKGAFGVFAKVHDFYNTFDGVAKRGGEKTMWFQVTTKSVTLAEKVRKFREVEHLFSREHDEVVIARWATPSTPGQRGAFWCYRWADDFKPQSVSIMSSEASALPWSAGP